MKPSSLSLVLIESQLESLLRVRASEIGLEEPSLKLHLFQA